MRTVLVRLILALIALAAPLGLDQAPAAAHDSYPYLARGSCVFEGYWTNCNTGVYCYRGSLYRHTYRPTGYSHQVCY